MSTYMSAGLYAWTMTLENGDTRQVLAPSLQSAIGGVLPAAVITTQRNEAVNPNDPPPAVASLVPPSATLGSPSFTLRVLGSGFRTGDVILWNGSPEPTTRVSATELTTEVNMSTAVVAMAIPVAVRSLTGQTSNTITFDLQAAP